MLQHAEVGEPDPRRRAPDRRRRRSGERAARATPGRCATRRTAPLVVPISSAIAVTSSATRPCSTNPPASVPACTGDPGLDGVSDHRRRCARAGHACAWRRSGNRPAASAKDGKFAMLITVGHQVHAALGGRRDGVGGRGRCRARCSRPRRRAARAGRPRRTHGWSPWRRRHARPRWPRSARRPATAGRDRRCDRSIQSPTILIQPSPYSSCLATSPGRSAGSSKSTPSSRMYRLVLAMCRPALISTGRSSRPTSGRVSSGDPQSRKASAPASRLVLACCSASSSVAAPSGRIADMAVRVDEPGQHPAGQLDGVGDRTVDEPAVR